MGRERARIAVLGGGPAGLSAAYGVVAGGGGDVRVDVYESSGRLGGVVTSETDGGFTYELGPASMAAKHAAVADLIERLGLRKRVVGRSATADNVFIVRDGAVLALPKGLRSFLGSRVLSWKTKARILFEPLVPKLKDAGAAEAESVGGFFERRFGKELVDYVVDPALAGIYSTRPADLSMKHAFARIWGMERKMGSVIGGLMRGGMKAPPDPRFKAYGRKELRASFSYDKGMEVIPRSLADGIAAGNYHGGKLRTNARVRTLDRDADGSWRVNGRGKYDAVISTIPSYALGTVESNAASVRSAFQILAQKIRYAPVSIVVLGFKKSQVLHALNGFGALVPTVEKRRILGVNFSSSNFPGRVTEPGNVYLTAYVGGTRNPELALRPARELVDLSTEELQRLLGVTGTPVFSRVKTWTQGIPQYTPGYDEMLCTMARLERRAPGLILGGNYRGGVGLPDALLSGIVAAEKALSYVGKRKP